MCVDMNLKCSSIYCKINVYHWVNSWSNTNHNHTSASFSAYVCSYFGSRLHSCPCRSTSLPLQKQNQWAADLQLPSLKNLGLSWRRSTGWPPMSSCRKALIFSKSTSCWSMPSRCHQSFSLSTRKTGTGWCSITWMCTRKVQGFMALVQIGSSCQLPSVLSWPLMGQLGFPSWRPTDPCSRSLLAS